MKYIILLEAINESGVYIVKPAPKYDIRKFILTRVSNKLDAGNYPYIVLKNDQVIEYKDITYDQLEEIKKQLGIEKFGWEGRISPQRLQKKAEKSKSNIDKDLSPQRLQKKPKRSKLNGDLSIIRNKANDLKNKIDKSGKVKSGWELKMNFGLKGSYNKLLNSKGETIKDDINTIIKEAGLNINDINIKDYIADIIYNSRAYNYNSMIDTIKDRILTYLGEITKDPYDDNIKKLIAEYVFWHDLELYLTKIQNQ